MISLNPHMSRIDKHEDIIDEEDDGLEYDSDCQQMTMEARSQTPGE